MSARHLRVLPRLETLESRTVLAHWGVSVVEGVLTVEGTNQNDRIVIALADTLGTLSVQFNTQPAELFSPTDADPTKAFSSILINGNGGNDRITVGTGVLLNATINAGNGNDWVWGGGGNDVIHGDAGNDHVYGGPGDDELHGDAGQDKVWGGDGNDTLFGEDGHDHLHGGAGDDTGDGGNGYDHLFGDDGNDVLHGQGGKDLVYGGLGVDELYGEGDKDHLYGQGDMDWLNGGDGQDKLWGGGGDDWIKGGWGNDHLNGNEGFDTLDGDEGVNKYWNGESIVTDMPETPPDGFGDPEAPQEPSYVTTLGTVTFTYQKVGGTEHVLEITGSGFGAGEQVFIFIGGAGLPDLFADPAGNLHVKFSSVPDQADETSFDTFLPDTYLVIGTDTDLMVNDLMGVLNLSVAS